MKANARDVWEHIFDSTDFDELLDTDGFFRITSSELKRFSSPLNGPDPRNLVKFDHSDQLPAALKVRQLSVLPVARGEFVVGPLNTYMPTPEEDFRGVPLRKVSLNVNLETLTTRDISSESRALMVAHASGMIEEFLGEPCRHTGFGKESPRQPFSFAVDRKGFPPIALEASTSTPMEIDGIYESASWIAPIEAKNRIHRDFHIRQIYYPMRAMVAAHQKKVRSVLFTHHNGIFQFREVLFKTLRNLSSFEVLRSGRFTIEDNLTTRRDLKVQIESTIPNHNPRPVSFPQADKFEKVLFVVERLLEGSLDGIAVADLFGYVPRQGDYYANAAVYLGLAKKSGGRFYATSTASKVFALTGAERTRKLAGLMLAIPSIAEGVQYWLKSGLLPSVPEMVSLMKREGDSGFLNPTTEKRRARTAIDWIDWLASNFDQ